MIRNKKLVSIIVPCYNVEKYFERCIKSLVSQTYKDIEIILIDDGSTDATSNLINRYKDTDKRIIVKKQQNIGLSGARNAGLKIAKGEYVCFVDSDDYVDKNYIKRMYAELERTGSDICACNYSYVYEDGVVEPRATDGNFVCDSWAGLKDMFSGQQKTGVVTWNKLYKKDLFKDNKIVFPVGKVNEDNFTTYKLYYFAKKICYVSDSLYYYVQRDDSIMGRDFDKRRMDVIEAYEETVAFFEKYQLDEDISEYLNCYRAMIYVNLYNKIVRCGYVGPEKNILKNDILTQKKKYLKNQVLSRKLKMMIRLLSTLPGIYNFVVRRGGNAHLKKTGNNYPRLFRAKHYIRMLQNLLKKQLSNEKLDIDYNNSVIFLLACDYNNIGDVLIRVSQEDFLRKNLGGKRIVTIGFTDTYRFLKDIEKNATKDTAVVLTGGGDVDDRYTELERARNYIIKLLAGKGCRIISFPQTVDFSNTKKGAFCLKKTKKAYASNKNFVFFAREKKSYDFASASFEGTKICLTPDIVLSHDTLASGKKRNGIGFLLRSDREKNIDEDFINSLLKNLKGKYKISKDDMVVNEFQKDKIYDYLNAKIDFVSSKQLIITDRLHGMILCYITNTPCIVFPNVNHKITETYKNWLAGKQNFIVLEDNKDIKAILKDIDDLCKIKQLKKGSLRKDFNTLVEVLNDKNVGGIS